MRSESKGYSQDSAKAVREFRLNLGWCDCGCGKIMTNPVKIVFTESKPNTLMRPDCYDRLA